MGRASYQEESAGPIYSIILRLDEEGVDGKTRDPQKQGKRGYFNP
jgi:hypothetical protein